MLWPSRILTICTLCWCALCFVSLSLLWRLQRFGLIQGCFTKFYLLLLTMNWTTDSIWHCFPYQHSHGSQGNHRRLGSNTLLALMSALSSFADFSWRKNRCVRPCVWSSSCPCINCSEQTIELNTWRNSSSSHISLKQLA